MSDLERWGLAAGIALVYALFCLWCARRPGREMGVGASDTLIAYASQSGTAVELANSSLAVLKGRARLLPLNQVDDQVLAATKRALFIASTYGHGEPPDNGARFAKRYFNGPRADLSHLEFAVLALGDSSYPQFCRFGRGVHSSLSHHGAQPLCDLIEMDAQQADARPSVLVRWNSQLRRLGDKPFSSSHTESAPASPAAAPYLPWVLQERRLLNPDSPGEPLFHLVFVAPAPAPPRSWVAGDIAEVVPHNWTRCREPIAPRKYSIASVAADGALELVVRQQRDHGGKLGLASGWLTQSLAVGETTEFRLCSNPLFRSPDVETPLLLIGNGSGMGGLRAHLRHRQHEGGGRNWLLFGERDPVADRIFATELDGWLTQSHLERLDLAFSRCAKQPQYVQDLLHTHADTLREWVRQGAVIMVCGSRVGMAEGVDKALDSILGRELLDSLDLVGRYRRDIY